MKVVVYAISKDDSMLVDRWYASMKEADEIYVLDLMSKDDTVDRLNSYGVNVSVMDINPFRMDVVRNKSLELVPLDVDICVCADMDEIFYPGWRTLLEKSWNDVNRLYYTCNIMKDNKCIRKVRGNRIHDRFNYRWKYPIYEELECLIKLEKISFADNILSSKHSNISKVINKSVYLLELSLDEYPDNNKTLFHIGEEYMHYKEWDKAIFYFDRYLDLDRNNHELRAITMLELSWCFKSKNKDIKRKYWIIRAIDECPNLKDGYILLGFKYYEEGKYRECIINLYKARLVDKCYNLSFLNEVEELLSICLYNVGLKDDALFYIDKALSNNPFNNRLLNNRNIIA